MLYSRQSFGVVLHAKILEPAPQGMGAPQADQRWQKPSGNHQIQLRFFILWVDFRGGVHSVSTRSTPPTGRGRDIRYFSIFKWVNVMPNFELKKDRMCEPPLNLALDSIVIVGRLTMTGRKDFVLWYLRHFGVKRLRREKCQIRKFPKTYFWKFGIFVFRKITFRRKK